MVVTISNPRTGEVREVTLHDGLVHEYQQVIKDMQMFFSHALDTERRVVHNKLSSPVAKVVREWNPEIPEAEVVEEARHIVTGFLEQTAPTGLSRVQALRLSGTLV